MAKMRVYDLAKELGIESKQIIETLNTTEYAVKAASSNIDDPALKSTEGMDDQTGGILPDHK